MPARAPSAREVMTWFLWARFLREQVDSDQITRLNLMFGLDSLANMIGACIGSDDSQMLGFYDVENDVSAIVDGAALISAAESSLRQGAAASHSSSSSSSSSARAPTTSRPQETLGRQQQDEAEPEAKRRRVHKRP